MKRTIERTSAIVTATAFLLTGLAFMAPTTTAQVCLVNQPCLGALACSSRSQVRIDDGIDPPGIAVAGRLTQTVCMAVDDCNGVYTVTVQASSIGPLDTVLGEVRCGGEHVAACTVQFTDVATGWSCSDTSGAVSGGDLACVSQAFDRDDGVKLEYTVSCAEPPFFPEW